MAHITADLVRETTTTTLTGTYSLAGAVTGFRDFDSVMADGDTCFYTARLASDFESGIGTFTSGTPDTLARTVILESSNSNNAVSWGAGSKDIYMGTPSKAVMTNCAATIASAATTNLGSTNAPVVDISGTTTITSFGSTAPTGALKFVRFQAALTLTHNATSMILDGIDIITAAGDSAIFKHEGSGNWRMVSNFHRANPARFLAYNSAQDDNVTGDNTAYTVIFDSEIFDHGGCYNAGTGTFTAQSTGPHEFCGCAALAGVAVAHTTIAAKLVTSNRTYTLLFANPGAIQTGGFLNVNWAVQADMDVGDTATVTITVSGSTKVVDIYGDATPATFFAGHLIR